MTKARIVDGKALIVAGAASHNDDCCCDEEEPIFCCDTVTPFSVDVDFASASGVFAGCCAELDGTYVLTQNPENLCEYKHRKTGIFYDEPTGSDTGHPQCAAEEIVGACRSTTFTDFSGTFYTNVFLEYAEVIVTPSSSGDGYGVSFQFRFREVSRTPTGCTVVLSPLLFWDFGSETCIVHNSTVQADIPGNIAGIYADCGAPPDGGPLFTLHLV